MSGFSTKAIHEGYDPKDGESVNFPIIASTTFKYSKVKDVHELFDLESSSYFYSRIANPTVDYAEKIVTSLEGGTGALMTSSGQAATTLAIMNVTSFGDNVLISKNIYGGTFNVAKHTLGNFGLEVRQFDQEWDDKQIESLIDDRTKLVIAESICNPVVKVLDIEKLAKVAHSKGVALLIDNTFATPYFCNPFKFGADIITHSTTKYMDGQAKHVGGMIVDSGNFDWSKNLKRYPKFNEPDPTYHGLVYSEKFGKDAFIIKARVQLMRDIGATASPFSADILTNGLKTLDVRMDKHFKGALEVANFLEKQEQVEKVHFPALKSSKYNKLMEKYCPKGCSGVLAIEIKGDRFDAAKIIEKFKLINLEVHVADIRTCALHPATSTHRQLSDQELKDSGIGPGLVRLSIGLEDPKDIISDLEQAFN